MSVTTVQEKESLADQIWVIRRHVCSTWVDLNNKIVSFVQTSYKEVG